MEKDFEAKLQEYAELAVRQGVNIKKGQMLFLTAPITTAPFARMVAKAAYEAGAKNVLTLYTDEKMARLKYEYAPLSVFEKMPAWQAEQRNSAAREGAAFLSILAENPSAFVGVPGEKLLANAKAAHKGFKEFYDHMDAGKIQWSLVAHPSPEWARKVFPDAKDDAEAEAKLFDAILKTVRVSGDGGAVKRWEKHDRMLKARGAKLNRMNLDYLHFENGIGTDLKVYLADGHIFKGGSDKTPNGRKYFPNMPTEEIFTMPHAGKTEGVVKSALPLSYQGTLIENFSLTFHGGMVTEFSAEKGEEALARLLATDEGSKRLGEVALVPYDSPISNSGILFYNTLFDENASCHLALGDCYPDTIEGGEKLSKRALLSRGGNKSVNHVDFMIGTSDLSITGYDKAGKAHPIFRDGNFVL